MIDSDEPFFERDGDLIVPTAHARGPWKSGTLHGRVVVGLLAAEIENRYGDPDFMPARLTVDMYSAPGMVPLDVQTRIVREGKRIRQVDAELVSEGKSMGRASCQFLRRTADLGGIRWHGETTELPLPDTLPELPPGPETMNGQWDLRWITGSIGVASQKRAWMREVRPMIGAEPLTPFQRVMAGADYVSPMTNFGEGRGFGYINSDVTVYLARLPVGEWIGYEALAQEESDGVAIGHCNLYDIEGRIGWGSVCALAQVYRATANPS